MNSPREKKQLRLLNEVLPDPTPPADSGGARQRVLASVSRLGALAAAMASMQTGCSGEQSSSGGQVPPTVDIPGTAATGGPVAPTADVPGTTATGEPVASASSTPVTPPSTAQTATNVPRLPPSYAVVDPMPPPARCLGVAPTVKTTAQWKAKTGGFTIEVKMGKPGLAGAAFGTTPLSVWGAKIVSQQVAPDSVTLTLEQDGSSTAAGISVPSVCPQGNSHIQVGLDLSKPPAAQAAIPVNQRDTY